MKVLIRVDASQKIGLGHLIRCRSLARALRTLGGDVCFCGRIPEAIVHDVLTREFRFLELANECSDCIDPNNGQWLSVSEIEDIKQMFLALQSVHPWRPDWVVIDHYGLSAEWHREIRDLLPGVQLAVVDDLANRPHEPDLLIDHNLFAGDLYARYSTLLPMDQQVRFCLGPQFALIDPFHSVFNQSLSPRDQFQRLLISLGGAGDSLLLEQILLVLEQLLTEGFKVKLQLVQGAFATESSCIQRLCDRLEVMRFHGLSSLAPLMATADVSIGAGGTSTWERLCLGLPCVTYALAPNQEAYSEFLSHQGLIEYLGSSEAFDSDVLKETLLRLHRNSSYLRDQSSVGMKLVDGHGSVRVARLMTEGL